MRSLFFAVFTLIASFSLAVEEKFFSQKINHHNSISDSFEQRYFVDQTYKQNGLSPIVLELCGESECGLYVSKISLQTQIAMDAKAEIIALEHRYYGKSQPFSNLETSALQFLSVEQAILDIRAFQRHIDPHNKRKWFLVGSSYAGTLAAVYRQRYPESTVGALSSSAPARATFSFIAYDKYTSDILGPKCAQQVRQLVSEIETKITGMQSLEDYKAPFRVPYIQNDLNFLFLISEFTTAFVQFGNGPDFCQSVDSIGALQAIAHFVNLFYADGHGLDLSTWGFETLANTEIEGSAGITRQWWYQVCREMGFFQVAHSSRKDSVRSALLDQQFFETICKDNYGIETTQISEFNTQYYEPLQEGRYSRIIFTNGTEDPWTQLSVMSDARSVVGKDSLFLLNKGGSHSSELYSQTGIMDELQQKIITTAVKWLSNK